MHNANADRGQKVEYRPFCLKIWRRLDGEITVAKAVLIIGGVLVARSLPTSFVERILFAERNEATRCIADGFGDHVWSP